MVLAFARARPLSPAQVAEARGGCDDDAEAPRALAARGPLGLGALQRFPDRAAWRILFATYRADGSALRVQPGLDRSIGVLFLRSYEVLSRRGDL